MFTHSCWCQHWQREHEPASRLRRLTRHDTPPRVCSAQDLLSLALRPALQPQGAGAGAARLRAAMCAHSGHTGWQECCGPRPGFAPVASVGMSALKWKVAEKKLGRPGDRLAGLPKLSSADSGIHAHGMDSLNCTARGFRQPWWCSSAYSCRAPWDHLFNNRDCGQDYSESGGQNCLPTTPERTFPSKTVRTGCLFAGVSTFCHTVIFAIQERFSNNVLQCPVHRLPRR